MPIKRGATAPGVWAPSPALLAVQSTPAALNRPHPGGASAAMDSVLPALDNSVHGSGLDAADPGPNDANHAGSHVAQLERGACAVPPLIQQCGSDEKMEIRSLLALGLTCVGLAASCSSKDNEQTPAKPGPKSAVEVLRPLTLTDRARLPEQDSNLASVEVTPNQLKLKYKSKPHPNFSKDDVVAGVMGNGYLRRVEKLAIQDKSILVDTLPAELPHFIKDGAFRIRVAPAATEPTTSGTQRQGLTATFPLLRSGSWTCSAQLQGGLDFVEIDPTLDVLSPELDFFVDIVPDDASLFGRLEKARFAFASGVELGVSADVLANYAGECSLDIVKAMGGPEIPLPPLLVIVGTVPILITQSLKPVFKVGATATVPSKGLRATASASFNFKAGVEYANGQWSPIWEKSYTSALDATPPGEAQDFQLGAKLTSGFVYGAWVYDLAGPKLSFEPGLSANVAVDLPACKWTASVDGATKVGLAGSVQIPGVSKEIYSVKETWTLQSGVLATTSGQLPGLLCVDAGVPLTDGGVAIPPVEPERPPEVPSTANYWWTESFGSNSSGPTGTSSRSKTTVFYREDFVGWKSYGTFLQTSTGADGSSMVWTQNTGSAFDWASGQLSTTQTGSQTTTDKFGQTKTVPINYSNTSVCQDKYKCAFEYGVKPGLDSAGNPMKPGCTVYGPRGWDGDTYTHTTVTNSPDGPTTTVDEYTCINCGGFPADSPLQCG